MKLGFVVPHWPLDDEVNEALRRCLASLPDDCEKLVIVNEGTGFARNVNLGLRLASGDFVGVTGNDTVEPRRRREAGHRAGRLPRRFLGGAA